MDNFEAWSRLIDSPPVDVALGLGIRAVLRGWYDRQVRLQCENGQWFLRHIPDWEPEWLADVRRAESESRPDWDQCLSAFIALHDAEDEPRRVLRFAQTYGLLGVCEHVTTEHLPFFERCEYCAERAAQAPVPSHLSPETVDPDDREAWWAWHVQYHSHWERWAPLRETIAFWVQLAGQFRAALLIAAHVQQDVIAPAPLWRVLKPRGRLLGDVMRSSTPWWQQASAREREEWKRRPEVEAEWRALGYWISSHTPQYDLQLEVRLADGHSTDTLHHSVELQPKHLVGALFLQLCAAVQGPGSLYICSRCGSPHTRKRRPSQGKPTYCPRCRRLIDAELERSRYRNQNPVRHRKSRYDVGNT